MLLVFVGNAATCEDHHSGGAQWQNSRGHSAVVPPPEWTFTRIPAAFPVITPGLRSFQEGYLIETRKRT